MVSRASNVWILSFRWTIDWEEWQAAKPVLAKWAEKVAKKWCYQLEVTDTFVPRDEHPDPTEWADSSEEVWYSYNLHVQGYLNLKEKQRPKAFACKWNAVFHGIEVSACSYAGLEALKSYTLKEDSRVEGPFADHPIYVGQDLPTEALLYPWQKELLAYCKGPVNDREILWVFDKLGGKGKSKFRKYMGWHHKAECLNYDTANNLLYQVVQSNSPMHIFIVNLTRSKPAQLSAHDLYSALETIKDGHVQSNKYTGGTKWFAPPHIIVFSNEEPDYKAMSPDRFTVKDLANLPLFKAPAREEVGGMDLDLSENDIATLNRIESRISSVSGVGLPSEVHDTQLLMDVTEAQ